MSKRPKTVDAYIAAAPKPAQLMLKQLRKAIQAAAPKAEERLSYGMPYYGYHGRLVYFAGYTHHIGLYMLPESRAAFAKEIAKYRTSKATLRFPIGKPLPLSLIKKIVRARVKENLARSR